MRHALEIAVIDDDEMIRVLIADILGRIDGTILCFNNASHALEYINADVPDILISDIDMPEKSGLQLLYKVKKEFPNKIFISMSGNHYHEKSARDLGSDAFLKKPFSPSDLLRMVQSFVIGRGP